MATAARAIVGLSSGYRAGMQRNKEQQQADEDRKIAAEDRTQALADADTARKWQEEARGQQRKQWGLADTERARQDKERATAEQSAVDRAKSEGLYQLSSALMHPDANPDEVMQLFNDSEMGTMELPKGTRYDRNTKSIVMPGADGTEKTYGVETLNRTLRERLGKEAPKDTVFNMGAEVGLLVQGPDGKFTTVEGSKRPEKKDGAAGNGFQVIGKTPNGRPVGRVEGSSTLVYGDTFTPVKDKDSGSPTRTATDWNALKGAQGDARKALGDRIGLKFDKDGIPMPPTKDAKGRPVKDKSELWARLSAVTDPLVAEFEDAVGAGQVANAVAEAFDGQQSFMELRDEIAAGLKKQETKVPNGKGGYRRQTADEILAAAGEQAKAQIEVDTKQRQEQAYATVSSMAEQTRRARGEDPAAAPAAAAPDAAAPAGGAPGPKSRAGEPITPQSITGTDTKALKQFKSNPALFSRLTAKDPETGEPLGVQMPDGTVYYLVGNELRSWTPPTR